MRVTNLREQAEIYAHITVMLKIKLIKPKDITRNWMRDIFPESTEFTLQEAWEVLKEDIANGDYK